MKCEKLTGKIIGCAMKVHSTLGNGFQEVIYHAEMSALLELIKDQNNLKKNILIIGHNPGLHLLIEHLTKTLIKKFPTCGFVKLSNFDSWKDLDANILDLEFFVTPRDLIHD